MIVWGLVGCAPEPPPTIYTVPTAPSVDPEPVDWIREGEVGDLFVALRGASRWEPRSLQMAALFADRLDGALYPAACGWVDELCAPLEIIDEEPVERTAVEVGRSSWLGDRLQVGAVELRFEVDPERLVGGYRHRAPFEGSLPTTLDLVVERGEWGPFQVPSAVSRPAWRVGLEPDPLQPLVLGGDRFATFRWEPVEGGQMWLQVRGPDLELLRPIANDGFAAVDFGGVRLRGPATVQLWQVRSTVREVGDHRIHIHSAAEQSWCVVESCDLPPLPSWPAYLPFTYCWSSDDCDTSRWVLYEDGTWEVEGYRGAWSYDCCAPSIAFVFGSGTVYTGTLGPDGCVEGEMRSWSGASGTWSGCF